MKRVATSLFRWTLGYLVYIVAGIILLLVTFLPLEQLRYRAASLMCRATLWALGFKLRVVGIYPDDQPHIFMANHASFLDIFIIGAIMKGKFTGVVAEEVLKHPFLRMILNRFRAIPIRRRDREAAIAAITMAEDRLQRGYQVGILPEGTRTLNGKLGPLKKGGFHMALNTSAPILPIGIIGAFRGKPKNTWHLRPGEITVHIGQPIPPGQYHQMTMDQAMEAVRRQLLVLTGEEDLPA
ncbi:lysophospholipid acyltransferase family protein [Candidatus Neomarinimicrobiota bacterium]